MIEELEGWESFEKSKFFLNSQFLFARQILDGNKKKQFSNKNVLNQKK